MAPKRNPPENDSIKELMPQLKPYKSPAELILILVISVFFAEFIVMGTLYYFRERLDPIYVILIDAPLLILILSPILYIFIFRPLLAMVHERQAAERALIKEKEAMKKYLDVAGVLVVALDTEGRVRLINRKGCEVLGYAEEEVLGTDWFDSYLPKRVRDEVRLVFASLIAGGHDTEGYFENPVLTSDGEERTVLWHNTTIMEEGRVAGTLSSGEDITERKLTEKALRESETRYRLVHNTAFDGIIISNARDKIIDCNDSALRMFGYARDELAGQDVTILVPEKYRKAHKQGLGRFLETGVSRIQGKIFEYEGVRKNGELFPLELALNNFTLGGIIHFTAMVRDITERKRAEREREIAQARMSQTQKMEAIGRFAGGIAHDFNNVLSAVRGNAELALEGLDRTDPAHARINGIITSVQLASRLTRQLLLFSRGQPFELVPMNVNMVISDLLAMISRIIGENITIATDLDPDLWTIEADEGNIEQVIMNLAINAKDAMPNGGKLTIRTENLVMEKGQAEAIPDARPGEVVCLTVTDTGVGMDKDLLPRIFEPFFTTKDPGKGTGFGLAIVYSTVRQHRGWITVASEPDKGTTFRICLPAIVKARAAGQEEAEVPMGSGEKVLLVEDDSRLRDFTKAALAEHGYNVTDASTASGAVEAFYKGGRDFKVLLSDISLSDQGGFQLADRLLTMSPSMTVVLMGGTVEKELEQIFHARRFGYLRKPFSITHLVRAVADSMRVDGR